MSSDMPCVWEHDVKAQITYVWLPPIPPILSVLCFPFLPRSYNVTLYFFSSSLLLQTKGIFVATQIVTAFLRSFWPKTIVLAGMASKKRSLVW